MHKAQCKCGSLWQLRIQLMARASAGMAFIKMHVAKWEGDASSCKLVQVKELTNVSVRNPFLSVCQVSWRWSIMLLALRIRSWNAHFIIFEFFLDIK